MKSRNIIIVLAGLLLMGIVSCTKSNEEYQPAQKETTAQVYFDKSLTTSFDISGIDYIEVPVSRADASDAATVTLEVSADAAFNVPTQISFEAGSATANVRVTWDETKVEAGKSYQITMSIKDEGTVYGNSSYTFWCSIPSVWKKFDDGHIYEICWQEDYETTMWYQETDYKNILYCKLVDAWWQLDDSGKPEKAVGDYYFYWDTETDNLFVPLQTIGLLSSKGDDVTVSSAAEFYNSYNDWGIVIPSEQYFSWAPGWLAKYGFFQPYYDGNGGFYLGDWMYRTEGGVANGYGYQFGGDPDYFIAKSFVRTVDYNDEDHIGSSAPAYTGNASSQYFSQDGGVTPYVFESALRYTELEDAEAATTTWYLRDYFGTDHCLAFTAPVPSLLDDGSAVSDVENEQFTGLYAFSDKIYVSIAGGTVTLKENETAYPIFSIQMKVYCRDDEGTKTYDFGTLTEVFSANGILKDAYTLDDISGTYLKYYLGKWSMTSYDYFYDTEDTYDVEILDGGNDTLKIVNLSGYSSVFADTLVASYNSSYGLLELHSQTLNAQYEEENIKMALFDPDNGKFYPSTSATMYAGMCEDGALAFVNYYSDINACGLFYYIGSNSGLCAVYNIYGFNQDSSAPAKFQMNRRKEYVTVDSGSEPVSSAMKLTRVSDKVTAVRNFSLTPVQKSSKSEKYDMQFMPEGTVNFQ